MLGDLNIRKTLDACVDQIDDGHWLLSIPSGEGGHYRVAQLDDYSTCATRSDFHWKPPVSLSLHARVSSSSIPGTWGFGFWNDPFSMNIGIQGSNRRFPALPEASWFFFASEENWLTLQEKQPGNGLLAAVFSSVSLPFMLLVSGGFALPFLFWNKTAGFVKKVVRQFVHDSGVQLSVDITDWHRYEIIWNSDEVLFRIDGDDVYRSHMPPGEALGLVIWIDNQYAALRVNDRVRFGVLPGSEAAWLEIKDIQLTV